MGEIITTTLIVFLSAIMGALIGIAIYVDVDHITPMDVYQGKTTLEYTIIDGVKVDSTVVWKNNQ